MQLPPEDELWDSQYGQPPHGQHTQPQYGQYGQPQPQQVRNRRKTAALIRNGVSDPCVPQFKTYLTAPEPKPLLERPAGWGADSLAGLSLSPGQAQLGKAPRAAAADAPLAEDWPIAS